VWGAPAGVAPAEAYRIFHNLLITKTCPPQHGYKRRSSHCVVHDLRSSENLRSQAPAGEARAEALVLHGLAVQLGPDLRVLYPMNVLNFGIAGELAATGPASPTGLKLVGTIRCGSPQPVSNICHSMCLETRGPMPSHGLRTRPCQVSTDSSSFDFSCLY